MEKQKLFQEFPSTSTKEWKDKITADLKGAEYNRKLVWRTNEGFEVQPFYREEDLKKLSNHNICPGDFPFLRGKKNKGNNWLVRQDINVKGIEKAHKQALDIRLKGVDSIGFLFNENYHPNLEDIEQLLMNIRMDLMELNYSSAQPLEIIRIVDELAVKYNRDLDKVNGSVDFDPLGHYSLNGVFRNRKKKDFKLLEELMQHSSRLTKFQVLTVDGSSFHNSGSGIVSQLAFTLAKGADYLNHLTAKGFEIDDIAPKIRFQFAVGSSYFMEIAKFRAAKYLWANIVNAYGLSNAKNAGMYIHCTNSAWNKTIYDPYVNMLRTTTETMSALIGGVDSMTVLPFNAIYEDTTDFSERIARNQQLVLKGESYFDKVADVGAGSYYIEELTNKIIDQAWKLFLEVDEMGGYLEAFNKGFITEKVRAEASAKDMEIAQGKRAVLGTNKYPNTGEQISKDLSATTAKNDKVLQPYRGAMAIEQLRNFTDRYAKNNKRPRVWMLTYGNLAMRNARSQFAGNFFGCAGFEIVNNIGFASIEKGIAAAHVAKPEIVVICSSDQEYDEKALQIIKALQNETIVALAGYPAELVEDLKREGFENYIHIRSNILAELTRYQKMLNIQ